MISDVKQAIISKLQEVYPTGYTIYDETVPESISKPAFLVTLINHSVSSRLNCRFTNTLTLDLSYYSDKTDLRADCILVQEELLRKLDIVGAYRALNKNAKIMDNVLHITFEIRYSEMIKESFNLMQQQQTNTNI